jgi:hypothetical protein
LPWNTIRKKKRRRRRRRRKRNKEIGLDNLVKQFVLDAVNLQLAIFPPFYLNFVCWTWRQSAVTISFLTHRQT